MDTVTTSSHEEPGLLLWLSGFGLSWFSPTFFYRVGKKPLMHAFGFFALFSVVLMTMQTVIGTFLLSGVGDTLAQGFEDEQIPSIEISGGRADFGSEGPLVILDEGGSLLVFDKTGQYDLESLRAYETGFILTGTTLIGKDSSGRLQEISLADLNAAVGDPIVVSPESIQSIWGQVTLIGALAIFGSVFIWDVLVRLAYLAFLALLMWGGANLVKRGTDFTHVLIAGIYTLLPVMVLRFVIATSLRTPLIPGVFSVMYVVAWAVALVFMLKQREETSPEGKTVPARGRLWQVSPLRAWRALLALPILIYIPIELAVITRLPWYLSWLLWFVSLGLMLIVSLLYMLNEDATRDSSDAQPPTVTPAS